MRAAVFASDVDADSAAKFWARIDKSAGPDACWPFVGAIGSKRKYGWFKIHGFQHMAHRVAFALTHGKTPADLFVCHHCDNPPCCNPKHLFAGTAADNTADMIRKGRKVTVSPKNPNALAEWSRRNPRKGSAHPRAKLNERVVAEIKAALAAGEKGVDIARRFGCSTYTVSNIRVGKQWSHV